MTTSATTPDALTAPLMELRGLTPDEVHRLVGHLYCEVILLQREKADLQRQRAEAVRAA